MKRISALIVQMFILCFNTDPCYPGHSLCCLVLLHLWYLSTYSHEHIHIWFIKLGNISKFFMWSLFILCVNLCILSSPKNLCTSLYFPSSVLHKEVKWRCLFFHRWFLLGDVVILGLKWRHLIEIRLQTWSS